jgi:hypothetical protein
VTRTRISKVEILGIFLLFFLILNSPFPDLHYNKTVLLLKQLIEHPRTGRHRDLPMTAGTYLSPVLSFIEIRFVALQLTSASPSQRTLLHFIHLPASE